MIESTVIEARIREGIPGVEHVDVRDLTGTKDHYEATVVASAFSDLSRVQQHQAVYRALGELMSGPVHALKLNTYSPEAWALRG
ncbi:MAG: BolA/IbaG family iron-sulfur metabolism protein [Myxococcales bacterium]|nr:BolA/IbaG family iron-sulfur metabolism protein [Myxococcales bacterium]